MSKWIQTEQWELFPPGFAQLVRQNKDIPAVRWVADYISGLTERQVFEVHRRLSGIL